MTWRGQRVLLLAAIGLLGALALNAVEHASGQTMPPTLGSGDWIITDDTVIEGWDVIMLQGNLVVASGGSLTLSDSTLLFVISEWGEFGIHVTEGSSLLILNGSTVGSSRPKMPWTCVIEEGCTLRLLDSHIEECGMPSFGIRPTWQEISLYVATSDALVENTTFTGGLAGLYFEEGVGAPPVRNCTFDNPYGIMTWGTSVEDCTFRDQIQYGVVFHGGTTGYVARCRFENVYSTSLQVGYEYFEPRYEVFSAKVRIIHCSFHNSTRGIRVLNGSEALVEDCVIDGIEREALVVRPTAVVEVVDGSFSNANLAILSEVGSHVSWTVESSASVRGGNVTLSGNLVLEPGATLDLIGIRNLTMLSRTVLPLEIRLGSGSSLTIVNGSIEVPHVSLAPHDWAPVVLEGPEASLSLVGVERLELAFPVELSTLDSRSSVLPLGRWTIGQVLMEDCDLVYASDVGTPSLTLGTQDAYLESQMIRCDLVGFSDTAQLFQLRRGRYSSYDFLMDLEELTGNSTIVWLVEGGEEAEIVTYWSMRAHVHWQNQLPIEGVDVVVADSKGGVHRVATGEGGLTPYWYALTGLARWDGTLVSYLPFDFAVDVSGLPGRQLVDEVEAGLTVDVQVLDLEPPRLTIDQGEIVSTNASEINLTGVASDAHSGVSFLEASVVPKPYTRIAVDPETGRFRAMVPLRLGMQTVTFRLYDSVGNRRVRDVSIYYSTSPPYLFIEEPLDGAWVNTPLTYLVGLTEPNSTLEAQGRLQLTETGIFRILVYLEEGPNLLVLNVTNAAGNRNSTQITLFLDTTPPSLVITSPYTSPYSTRRSREEIRGSVEEGAQVFINSVEIQVYEDGRFSNNVSLEQGTKRFLVMAMDDAGNTVVTEVIFHLDSEPPTLEVLVEGMDAYRFIGDGLLRTSAERLTLVVRTDEGTYLEVGGKHIELVGNEAVVAHQLEDGLQGILVYAEDQAGNSIEFGPINVEVDRTPPVLTLSSAMPHQTEEALFTLKGATEPNVTIRVNGAQISVDFLGGFSRNFLLSHGTNVLVVVAEDRYGQTTSVTHTVEMEPPNPPPLEGPVSNIPLYLVIAIAILVVEALLLELWWWRQGPPEEWGR